MFLCSVNVPTLEMKTLVIDQHPAILQGIKCSLASSDVSFEVECVQTFESLDIPKDILLADVIVLGIPQFLPKLFEWINAIRKINKHIPILVYGVDKESLVIERLMMEPIQAIVTLQYDFSKLSEVILRTACSNSKEPVPYGFRYSRYTDFGMNDLSHREVEIVDLIANELTTSEISSALNISVSTVENHRKNIFRKMGVKNLAGMVRSATKAGYIS